MTKLQAMVGWLVGALALVGAAGAADGAGGGFLLVRADGQVQPVTVVEINQRTLVHGDPDRDNRVEWQMSGVAIEATIFARLRLTRRASRICAIRSGP